MDRREFLKSALAFTALSSVAKLSSVTSAENTDKSANNNIAQVTRRPYKNTTLTLPLLGFGMMRLPQISPDNSAIDYATTEKMIASAMAAGINYFDTAYMYHDGLSEKYAGDLLTKYPRNSYYLANKMPVFMASSADDVERIFNEQLQRCKTDYFDFYLLHALDAGNWETAKKFRAYEFLSKMKAAGKIRQLGFSFHDTPEVLQEIANAQPWDFALLQLNYLDWELYRSREQYEIMTALGIPVMVMEPLRGGSLASLNPQATAILQASNKTASNASWALRYVASLPNVICVLSGMSLPEHVENNIATFAPFSPLNNAERETIAQALIAYRQALAVPCTACRYCLPCPVGVDIPRIFGHFNQYKGNGNAWLLTNNYNSMSAESRADKCVSCNKCISHCPQKIDIPKALKMVDAEIKKL